jgi:electron transfer flavoprotein beta subunit
MGRESIDFNGGMVHGMVGELLGMPSFSPVMKLELEGNKVKMAREIEGGKEQLEAQLPLIAGCQEPIAEWKIPNMRGIMAARTRQLTVIPASAIEELTSYASYDLPPAKSACKMISADNMDELVQLLHNEAKVI